uniref:Uncharacterized protein n=1 Tax=Panagrolaimus davidi TaxID=227884 RepID=A0A914R6D5_9BILA
MNTIYLILSTLLLSFNVISAIDQCHSNDHSPECQAHRRQAFITKDLQHQVTDLKKIIEQSGCSICNIEGITACYNNGTCIPTPGRRYNYTCDCPENTTGPHCDIILSCDNDNNCGTNAECYVVKHQKRCQCLPGYTGNASDACTLRTKKASLVTDPHYTTFDGTIFDYMGTCPYYVMKACDPAVDFSITSTSYLLPGETSYKTYAKEMTFKTQGHEFKVDNYLKYYVDGVVQSLSPTYYWPNQTYATIIASKPSDTVTITDTVTNAVITFSQAATVNPYALTVEVPLTPFFYGANVMCGIFGSIDDNCFNDIAAANGSVYQTANCTFPFGYVNATVATYADTWVTNSTVENCMEGSIIGNITSGCNITNAQEQCGLIRQAIDGLGPFGACKAMGHDVVDKFYHDCTYDICQNASQCGSLDIFAKLCQQNLPFVNIDNWRTSNFCNYTCPPHSTYTLKFPTCQNSCADPHSSNSSTCTYQEGCKCDFGYYFDSNSDVDGFNSVCIPLDECGCINPLDGNYKPAGSQWLDPNCTVASQCTDGQISSQPVECSKSGKCVLDAGHPTCQCNSGYTGTGYNCTDINECNDTTVCNANTNQGICINLPGTYKCNCLAPFTGPECSEYMPSRHCADIQLFHGFNESGVYNISIGADYSHGLMNEQLNWTLVYCDLESFSGGWTLMTHGNITANKTYPEYINGFGDPSIQNVWLGLRNINAMTRDPTSLRVIVEYCPHDIIPSVDCTYDSFHVTDYTTKYAVFINSTCQSNSGNSTSEGWVTWDRTQLGPAFVNFDMGDVNSCSDQYNNVGWWYHNISRANKCGQANLNGLHFTCQDNNSPYQGSYLTWNYVPVKEAYMYLRPNEYPNYDPHH